MKKTELLAPAGSFEALAAAVESGADAVYLGGSKFNARAYADNFDNEMLKKALDYAHLRGVKVYVTLNILINDQELPDVLEYVGQLYHMGVDALIVQDIALLRLVGNLFPDFDIHCSTQMTVHNTDGALFLEKLGAKRIVLARELALKEIQTIRERTKAEIEVFVHGALCVCYSGQCYMSSLIGGRSGNRGRCAQPCRKAYRFYDMVHEKPIEALGGKHILSTRDLNTHGRLEELVQAGVASLKIEGRMKKPEYVAIVVKNYRDALDGIKRKEAQSELKGIFNREFTEGYIFEKRNKEIVSIDRPDNRGVFVGKITGQKGNFATVRVEENDLGDGDGIEIVAKDGRSTGLIISGLKVGGDTVQKASRGQSAVFYTRESIPIGAAVNKTLDNALIQKARREYSPENIRKIPIHCELKLFVGEKPEILLTDLDGIQVKLYGHEIVEKAEKTPADPGRIKEQLQKTGDTPFIMTTIKVEMNGDCHIPLKMVNQLRRDALESFAEKRIKSYRRSIPQFDSNLVLNNFVWTIKSPARAQETFSVSVRNRLQAEAALSAGIHALYLTYMDNNTEVLIKQAKASSTPLFYVLPNITREKDLVSEKRNILKFLDTAKDADYSENTGLVLSNPGQYELAQSLNVQRIRANYSHNLFNTVSASLYRQLGYEIICPSFELKLQQIRQMADLGIPVELLVYGHLPAMTTAYCPLSILSKGKDCGHACKEGQFGLMDEKGKIFPVIKEKDCTLQLLNSDVIFMLEEMQKLRDAGLNFFRLDFYLEKPDEIYDIINMYMSKNSEGDKYAEQIEAIKRKGHTKGHYFRGVE